jgi:uncharacterized protein involved in outer membrane biogenesis/outer membrane protein OmpA-like peptidoglycan-associated protein
MQVPFFIPPQWLRRCRWFLGGLLVVWVLAWLAGPLLAKRLIEVKGSAALGRTLTIGSVDFYPWSLELMVHDLSIATADGSTKQLSIERLYVDAELESALRMAVVVDAITVDAPTLHLAHRGDGHYDVEDILAKLNNDSAPIPASAPLPFALYNVTINGGAVDFIDHLPSGERHHKLRALHLAIPFLSTLDSKREVKVQPRLAFELNGSHFDTTAEGTPFAQNHKGDATIKIAKLDLAPYLPYLPASLPVRLQRAVVDADLRLGFEQTDKAMVALKGSVKVSGLAVADVAGKPLLGVETIAVELTDVRPLERIGHLASLEITGPKLQVTRNSAGHINLDMRKPEAEPVATKNIAAPAVSTGANAKKDSNLAPVQGVWSLALERLTVHKGDVRWTDDSMQPQAQVALTQLNLKAHAMHWPLSARPFTFEGSANLPLRGKAARLSVKGKAAESTASVHAAVGELDLGLVAPYVTQFLLPGVMGVLDAEVDLRVQGDALQLAVPRLTVRDFTLIGAKDWTTAVAATATNAERAANEMPSFKLLEVADAQFDMGARTGTVGMLALRSPNVMVHRDAQGQWTFQRWLKATPSAATQALAGPAPEQTETPTKPPVPWQLALGELLIADGNVKLEDRRFTRPARLEVSALQLQLKGVALDGTKPAPLTLSARIKSGRAEPGSLRYQGTVMWAPLTVQGSVDAVDLPVHGVAPYFADHLNIAILRADASYKGQVRYAASQTGAQLQLQGDAALEDFRANSVVARAAAGGVVDGSTGSPPAVSDDLGVAEELLSWKSLNAPGITLSMTPGSATRVQVREATLSDFYARLIVNANGRLNLQDMVKAAPVGPPASAPQAATAPIGPSAPSAQAAVVTMGPITLVNGRVLFSDRFIRPNYSADLSELSGKLSEFSSQAQDGSVQLADLVLRGRAEGTAALEISGKINPLAKPLAMDIKGRVRDLDLPPLTAYAIKYAGYGIERGKLSMDVQYAVQPDGQLLANNNLVLNQLSFGDKVEGAPNSLPVKLAVALLADRNGVIDINLPISGSLNDPQFSIGAVVWKIFTNLVTKALTAPFSLLANAFSGSQSEDHSTVNFAPGSSALAAEVAQGLDKIAQALADRPALHVTVVGTASPALERDAFKRERLKVLLLAEKRRRAAVGGQDVSAVAVLTDAEYPVLLKDVYRRADIAKPRNLVGLAKDLPVAEMEALLLASISVTEDAIHTLAQQRGVAVKDYLASRKVGVERLFLGAPKIVAPDGDSASDAPWKPHAELSVTSR